MLDLNNIYVGDNLELLKLIDNESIDLHFTSPVYAKMKKYENSDGVNPDTYVDWIMPRILEIERTLKYTGSFILNINDRVVDDFRHPYVFDLVSSITKNTKLKLYERLFWNKGKFLPHPKRFGDKIEYILWFVKSKDFHFDIDKMRVEYSELSIKRMKNPIKKRFNRTQENQDSNLYKDWAQNPKGALPSTLVTISSEAKRRSNIHMAVFPIKLAEYFINGATKEGDLVCDIFMGSGTTAIAAKKLGRNYLGFELSKEYVNESRINL